MNALVIYDTTFGNTQQIAQVIAHLLLSKALCDAQEEMEAICSQLVEVR